jgi:hypothetical protein
MRLSLIVVSAGRDLAKMLLQTDASQALEYHTRTGIGQRDQGVPEFVNNFRVTDQIWRVCTGAVQGRLALLSVANNGLASKTAVAPASSFFIEPVK